MRRKSKVPDDTFLIPQENYRPVFTDSTQRFEEAAEAYYKVVELLFPKLDDQEYSIQAERQVKIMIPHWGVFYPRGRATMHTGDPALRQAMNELFAKVQAAIEAAHLAGVERGKQLLIQLSKGELTMKQFNENAVEENQNTNYG